MAYIHALDPYRKAFSAPLCGRADFHINELISVDKFKLFASSENGLCWECASILGIKRLEDA